MRTRDTALACDPRPARLDAWTTATLPAHVGAGVIVEFVRRLGETLVLCSSSRYAEPSLSPDCQAGGPCHPVR